MLKIFSRAYDEDDGHLKSVMTVLPSGDVHHMHALEPQGGAGSAWCEIDEAMTWLDLFNPTRQEELFVEDALGIGLPTREDMNEIEISSRLYAEDGAVFMTAQLAFFGGREHLQSGPVTFVLFKGRLVTIRYVDPQSFKIFADQINKTPALSTDAAVTFTHLLDVIIDRTADLVEKVSGTVDEISNQVFAARANKGLDGQLRRLGRTQNDIAKLRDSLLSFARLLSYVAALDNEAVGVAGDDYTNFRDRIRSLNEDVQSLSDHAAYVTGNISYLQEAALGLINIEQNSIIKIFSVASVAFLPPTLIASIYGMNFEHMPELRMAAAYPVVIAAMVLSAVLPLLWFKHKGWL